MQVNRIGTVLFAGALAATALSGCDGGGETGAGGSATTATTATTTTTTPPVEPVPLGTLGITCALDSDCGTGKCSQVTDYDNILGGGPPNGYCTQACAVDADCPADGACIPDGYGSGQCFLECAFGEPQITSFDMPLDPTKCHGREDVRCQKLQGGAEVCLPICGADAQCDGRVCDARRALCTDAPHKGKALGEDCNPDAEAPECAGICLSIGPDGGPFKNMCTSPCVMAGAFPDTYDCGGPDKGLCVYSSGHGAGDHGYCAELCTAQYQCNYPSFFCFDLGLPDNGVCVDSTPCETAADCGRFMAEDCVPTTAGKFCMSTTYPLGPLQPTGTGGEGGAVGGAGGATGGAGGAAGGAGGAGGSMGGAGGAMGGTGGTGGTTGGAGGTTGGTGGT
jgi:hypothetical protein